jgi:hypothetical protein
VKLLLAGGLVAAALVIVGAALGARAFPDPTGDVNAAPDITSLEVSQAAPGVLGLRLSFGNYQTLPEESWVNVWFDIDSNASTGDAGDEAVVRYLSSGKVELYTWNGSQLVPAATDGIAGAFSAGVLTLSVPRASIKVADAFGILVVSSRGQELGSEELIASDYAPDVGRSAYSGSATTTFPDPANDHDAAPDVTSVRVSDARNGWIRFAITTPNYTTLPVESAIVLTIDTDDNQRTGDDGAEARVNTLGGELSLDRWNSRTRTWVADELPTRAHLANSGHVVTIDLHDSELGGTGRFGFSVLTADVNTAIQTVLAVDFSPDDRGLFHYTLANRPALTLVPTRLFGTPSRPHAGKQFAVNLGVNRSDTNRPVTTGSVVCRVRVGKVSVRATGTIAAGGGRCSLRVPVSTSGSVLRGKITVRSGGKTVAKSFSYVVL